MSLPERRQVRVPAVSDEAKGRFIEALEAGYSVTAAADEAGVHRRRLYELKDRDDAFADTWADAYQAGTDRLRDEVRRRALEGVEEPIVSAGKIITTVRRYSDNLLMFELKRRDPAYRDSVTVDGGKPVTFVLDSLLERARSTDEIDGEVLAIEDEGTEGRGA
jgi:hypothetical protein